LLAAASDINHIRVRARLVGPSGSRTIIERMPLLTLFEISAQNEGFYRIEDRAAGAATFMGHIDIAKGGALALSNSHYVSLDVSNANGVAIQLLEVNSLQHPNTVQTYLHYNPVTITQNLQNVQLDRAVAIVLPIQSVSEVLLTYPSGSVAHTGQELRYIADMTNDLVSVRRSETGVHSATFGYESNIILGVKDQNSGQEATRMQVEGVVNTGQFNIYLVEEKSL
jgi:hypothetical protein